MHLTVRESVNDDSQIPQRNERSAARSAHRRAQACKRHGHDDGTGCPEQRRRIQGPNTRQENSQRHRAKGAGREADDDTY